jgi:hypothetical protein
MKSTKQIILLLLLVYYCKPICEIDTPTHDFKEYSIFTFFKCTPSYGQIYSNQNNQTLMNGAPERTPHAQEDLFFKYMFKQGYITVSSVDKEYFSFYTNRHLVYLDYITIFIVILILNEIRIHISLKYCRLFYIFSIVYIIYLAPIGFIGPLSSLDFRLTRHGCVVEESAPVAFDLVISSFISRNHNL